MKKNNAILLLAFLMAVSSFSYAQDLHPQKNIEMDVSLSPRVSTIFQYADVISSDFSIRYKFFDSFSAGIGFTPTFIDYSDDALIYVPFCISLRYNLMAGKKVSPYFLLNAGGSFFQLTDPEYQGRFAIGADFPMSDRVSLFFEVGLSYTTLTMWSPFSFGIRL